MPPNYPEIEIIDTSWAWNSEILEDWLLNNEDLVENALDLLPQQAPEDVFKTKSC